MPPVSFDLTQQLKELQLQHGLRVDDFTKYRQYLTGKIHTLRKQLKLCQPHKPKPTGRQAKAEAQAQAGPTFVPPKPVTATNATTPNHVLLAALLAERCWAESEEYRLAATGNGAADVVQRHGGSPTSLMSHSRSRLNKAVKYAFALREVARVVGDERLSTEVCAYVAEMHGRCAISHERLSEAKKHLIEARETFAALKDSSSQQQWLIIQGKITECDDRVLYCMQCLHEDPTTYKPKGLDSAGDALLSVSWLDRSVPVYIVRAKEMIRQAEAIDVFPTCAKLLAAVDEVETKHGREAAAWGLYQQQSLCNKLVDQFDRCIGLYNDALDVVSTALKDGTGGDKSSNRLLEAFLRFQNRLCTAHRMYLVVRTVYARYIISGDFIAAGKNTYKRTAPTPLPGIEASTKRDMAFTAQQIANPIDVVRLLEKLLETLQEMSLLPGVEKMDSISGPLQAMILHIKSRQAFLIGETWRIAGKPENSVSYYKACQVQCDLFCRARQSLSDADFNQLSGRENSVIRFTASQLADEAAAAIAVAATMDLRKGRTLADMSAHFQELRPSSSIKGSGSIDVVSDHLDEFNAFSGFATFPPDFRSMPCKPLFVDIASTYLDFDGDDMFAFTSGGAEPAKTPTAKPTTSQSGTANAEDNNNTDDGGDKKDDGKGGWFSGWGWGKKKR